MFAAHLAVLLVLKLARHQLFVFAGVVHAAFANRTLQLDQIILRHTIFYYYLLEPTVRIELTTYSFIYTSILYIVED